MVTQNKNFFLSHRHCSDLYYYYYNIEIGKEKTKSLNLFPSSHTRREMKSWYMSISRHHPDIHCS